MEGVGKQRGRVQGKQRKDRGEHRGGRRLCEWQRADDKPPHPSKCFRFVDPQLLGEKK